MVLNTVQLCGITVKELELKRKDWQTFNML